MDISLNIISDIEAVAKYDDKECIEELSIPEDKVLEFIADNGDVLLIEYIPDVGMLVSVFNNTGD